MSDFTNVAANFMNNMANPARSASAGYARGQAQGAANERTNIARMGVEQENQQMEDDREQAVAKKYAGMAMMANTPELWGALQKNGVMQDIPFEGRMEVIAAGLDPSGINSYMNPPITEIADPNSPTGSTMVPRSQAIGKPGMPPSSTEMETITKPDGSTTTRFRMGRGSSKKGKSGLATSTKSVVQKKILSAGDTLANVMDIKARFKPEYQAVGARAGFTWDAFKDKWADTPLGKITGDLDEEDKQALSDFTSYRATAAQNFAMTLKDMSGVAVNPTEFKRTEAWLPNPGSGMFDGDSPTELQSKIDRFEGFTRKAMAKYHYINRNGLTINDVDVDDMPVMINQRGNELSAKYTAQGLDPDAVATAVKAALSDEFGLAQ